MKSIILAALILSAFAIAVAVPETSGWVLMAVIFGTVGAVLRRRRAASAVVA